MDYINIGLIIQKRNKKLNVALEGILSKLSLSLTF